MSTIWDFVFDSEWRQRADIESLKQQANAVRMRMSRTSVHMEERVEHLEQQVSELALLSRALLAVLEKQGGVKPEALQEEMRNIAGQDALDAQAKEREEAEAKKNRPRPLARRNRRLD
jgi:hypothetical protein